MDDINNEEEQNIDNPDEAHEPDELELDELSHDEVDQIEASSEDEIDEIDEIDEAEEIENSSDHEDEVDEIEGSSDEENEVDSANDDIQDTIEDNRQPEDVETHDAAFVPPVAPPAPEQAPPFDRLTRDPTATFGGVLSGIAHRYGWDVSLTRIAFVVLLIVSGGTAILAYLLSWVVIPRATHWPPPRAKTSRPRLSGRDLGIGLVALGALVVLGIGSGEAAAVLVPLALVGGGIWLLLQNPRDEQALSPAGAGGAVPFAATQTPTASTMQAAPSATVYAEAAPPRPPASTYAAAPVAVPKRSRLRRVGLVGLFGFLGLILLALVAIPLAIIALIVDADIDIDPDAEFVYTPATVDELPVFIAEDSGEIRLDLREVDFSSITADDDPFEMIVDLDFGRIEVLLPQDVRVDIDAENDLGDVTVLGSNDDGIGPSLQFRDDDPQLELDIDLNVGEIVVTRGATSSTTTIEVN